MAKLAFCNFVERIHKYRPVLLKTPSRPNKNREQNHPPLARLLVNSGRGAYLLCRLTALGL